MTMTVDAIRNKTKFRCGIEAAAAHLVVVNAIQKPEKEINQFPEDLIIKSVDENDSLVSVAGLEEVMLQCYSEGILPSEYGGSKWAVKPETKILSE